MTDLPTIDRTPFYAAAGAADAAVTSLRELPARLGEAVNDPQLRVQLRQRLSALPADVQAFRHGFPDTVLQVQSRAADLPQRVRERAGTATGQAVRAYRGFADRGEGVVGRLRGEAAPVVGEAVSTVRGRVADAAEGVAAVTEKAADDLAAKR
ncbi:hypothetical protein CLV30_12234 [Haloactinopolyspora alba]|uniref:Heparin binding hemagglutinin HbhA n=1 Tax=Haloactinopolyspora alba TaxID=648780 RepID=A0A2P8DJY9_9ACTN|nr:hypothetical protein [Haloactinopolyspora alba]PSK97542.1 hypothetical protein CLV30_12234 [Haloactinopolyspora alba]